MKTVKGLFINIGKLLLLWLFIFQFQRIMFSIHNWSKFTDVGFWEYFGAYFHSFRLDLATACILGILPLLFLILSSLFANKFFKVAFKIILYLEVILVACLHAGEINAYTEWNHKLTSRVFTHLANPDEVVRSADWSMTIWFFLYAFLEIVFSIKLLRYLFKKPLIETRLKALVKAGISILAFGIFGILFFILARGGTQPIPINIDAAYYSANYVANDLSVNSFYFFSKSFLLYRRSDIDDLMPKIDPEKAEERTAQMLQYNQPHNNLFLKNQRPNIVFVVLESWSANAVSCLSSEKNTTPNFDRLAKEGILFSNFYATGGTSEIGNASIFSGYPALPEISLSMQPDKHRKLPALNEDLENWGYNTNYMFSGDLKYGNIGGFFTDHGFDQVLDENDFPKDLKRGKLNYYDPDLYDFLISKIDESKEPFLHCAFTGSTHSPYDHPRDKSLKTRKGVEADFMISMTYSDKALAEFIEKCRAKPWFDNTLFVFVADHGHAAPLEISSANSDYYRIPLLFWGPALKDEFKGRKIETITCQTDIPATLLYQMGGDIDRYPWSRDMMSPNCPEFVLHTIQRGYGFVTPGGNMTYLMDTKTFIQNDLPKKDISDCHSFLLTVYRNYKSL